MNIVVDASQQVDLAQHARLALLASGHAPLGAAQERAAPAIGSGIAERAEERQRTAALVRARLELERRIEIRTQRVLQPLRIRLEARALVSTLGIRLEDSGEPRRAVDLHVHIGRPAGHGFFDKPRAPGLRYIAHR